MRRHALVLMLLSPALVVAGTPRSNLTAEQQRELQGTWVATSAVGFGKDTPPKELQAMRLVIKGDQMTVHYGDRTAKATYKLATAHTPAWIDVTVKDGPEDVRGKTFRGIYLVEGPVLRVAFPEPGQERPQAFAATDQTKVHGIVFKRQAKK